MQVQSTPTVAPIRRTPQSAPRSDDTKGIAWGNVALLAGTAIGALGLKLFSKASV